MLFFFFSFFTYFVRAFNADSRRRLFNYVPLLDAVYSLFIDISHVDFLIVRSFHSNNTRTCYPSSQDFSQDVLVTFIPVCERSFALACFARESALWTIYYIYIIVFRLLSSMSLTRRYSDFFALHRRERPAYNMSTLGIF